MGEMERLIYIKLLFTSEVKLRKITLIYVNLRKKR